MSKQELADGTVVTVDWSEGGVAHVVCACGKDDIYLNASACYASDYPAEAVCLCGKRYGASPYVAVDIEVDGTFVVTL